VRTEEENPVATIGDRLLTLREAAEVLRLNPLILGKHVSCRELESRIGGGIRQVSCQDRPLLKFHWSLQQSALLSSRVIGGGAAEPPCSHFWCF
jgi:hypothetical protein